MTTTEIRDMALQLPPDERAVLAHELLASVAEPTGTGEMANGPQAMVNQIVAMTSQLFQTPATVKESYDPEFPNEKHLVFVAETRADNAAILDLEGQWNRRVTQLFPGWH